MEGELSQGKVRLIMMLLSDTVEPGQTDTLIRWTPGIYGHFGVPPMYFSLYLTCYRQTPGVNGQTDSKFHPNNQSNLVIRTLNLGH